MRGVSRRRTRLAATKKGLQDFFFFCAQKLFFGFNFSVFLWTSRPHEFAQTASVWVSGLCVRHPIANLEPNARRGARDAFHGCLRLGKHGGKNNNNNEFAPMADPAVAEEVPVVEGEASSGSPPGDGRLKRAGSRSGSKRRSEGRADGDGSDADSLSSLSLSDDGRPAPVMPVATDQDARIAVAEQAAGEDGTRSL